jgi:hypothetical protein
MTNPFDISTMTSTIRLDNKGQGEFSFTVKNTDQKPMRGRAIADADNPDVEKWLSVMGEAERDFAAGGVHQYTMQVKVPPTATAGNYPAKLKMVGVENPDEIYTYSPTVTFEVGKPTAKPSSFPWWIIIVAAVVLVLLVVGVVIIVVAGGGNNEATATQTAVANLTVTANAASTVTQQATATAQARLTATARAPFTFDLVSNARQAVWTVGPVPATLTFPNSEGDSRGFVLTRANARTVDGRTVPLLLETHPQWVANGTISGCYSNIYSAANPVQERDQLSGRVSFLASTIPIAGDVTFRVIVVDGGREIEIFNRRMIAAGNDSFFIREDLRQFSGKTPTICLRVDAGLSSGQDWATWDDLKISRPQL